MSLPDPDETREDETTITLPILTEDTHSETDRVLTEGERLLDELKSRLDRESG